MGIYIFTLTIHYLDRMHYKYFSYPLREGQSELIDFVSENVSREENLCIEASTGFGKTACILAALLPLGNKILWTVRTGNEADRPVEEVKKINEGRNQKFFAISYRGKKDMCLLSEDMKLSDGDWRDTSLLCKLKRKDCPYAKMRGFNPLEWTGEPLLYSEIIQRCRDNTLCPYLAQRSLLPLADLVGLSYNYVIEDSLSWGIRGELPFDFCILVTDEAHNIESACSNLNSARITRNSIDKAATEIGRIAGITEDRDKNKLFQIESFIYGIRAVLEKEIMEVMKESTNEEIFDPGEFFSSLKQKLGFGERKLSRVLRDACEFGEKYRAKQLMKGKAPHSSLHRVAEFFSKLKECYGIDGVAFIKTKYSDNYAVEIWDMRSAEILEKRWKNFKHCLFCSGTLTPFNAFAETIGLEKWKGKQFRSRYPRENIRSLILKGVSTQGEYLDEKMKEKYLMSLNSFSQINTNLAVFASSYRVLQDLLHKGLERILENNNKKIFVEYQGMSGQTAREMMDQFRNCSAREQKGILLGSASGRFAEGADFPAEELEGIYLAGVPFERVSLKSKLHQEYYKKLYGEKKGKFYAYVLPALRKASQCMGRGLRSLEDKVLLVAGDERYIWQEFFRYLPDYFKETVRLVDVYGVDQMMKKMEKSLFSE